MQELGAGIKDAMPKLSDGSIFSDDMNKRALDSVEFMEYAPVTGSTAECEYTWPN